MKFVGNNIYHVYNRSFNKHKVFFSEENYMFFLNKVTELKSLCDILAYCLMPDHFHLMIYLSSVTRQTAQSGQTGMHPLARKIGTILSSYTQAINKLEKSKGSLFQPKTKAKELDENSYAATCFHYIHQNPLKASLVSKIEEWKFSSFVEYYRDINNICNKELAFQLINLSRDKGHFYKESSLQISDSQSLKLFENE